LNLSLEVVEEVKELELWVGDGAEGVADHTMQGLLLLHEQFSQPQLHIALGYHRTLQLYNMPGEETQTMNTQTNERNIYFDFNKHNKLIVIHYV